MERERALGQPRGQSEHRAPDGGLQPVRAHARARESAKNACTSRGSGSSSSARTCSPASRDHRPHRRAVERPGGGRSPRTRRAWTPAGQTGSPRAEPRRAPQPATRAASRSSAAGSCDVLEHVRQDRQVERTVAGRQRRRRRRPRPSKSRAARARWRAASSDTSKPCSSSAEPACPQLRQQRAVAAADLDHPARVDPVARAQLDHVRGLAARRQLAPADVPVVGAPVGVVVEAARRSQRPPAARAASRRSGGCPRARRSASRSRSARCAFSTDGQRRCTSTWKLGRCSSSNAAGSSPHSSQMIRAISATVISSSFEMLKSSFSAGRVRGRRDDALGDVVDVGDRPRLLARSRRSGAASGPRAPS